MEEKTKGLFIEEQNEKFAFIIKSDHDKKT